MKKYVLAATAVMSVSGIAHADSFINGGFENGTASGWNEYSSAYRGNILNAALTPTFVKNNLASGNGFHSAVIGTGYTDTIIGAALGTTVYSGSYSYRVEDTTTGGYASLIEQRVNAYQDANIFFAWKAVLENGGHSDPESAAMVITLRDLTTGTDIISRLYNAGAGGGGVDTRFTALGSYFYTPQWQIEQLAIGPGLAGHDFLLSVIAADCNPTGHRGYVFLDGFGAVTPPPQNGPVPEAATWMMMIFGFGFTGSALRYQRRSTKVSFA